MFLSKKMEPTKRTKIMPKIIQGSKVFVLQLRVHEQKIQWIIGL
jgi:hypothetical protein